MRCVVLLIIHIMSFSNAKDVDLRLTPMCIVQLDGVHLPCAYFKERSLEKVLEGTWKEKSINKTSSGQMYTNISLVYTRKSEMSSLLVMVRYDQYKLPRQTWEIQPLSKADSSGPLTVMIAYTPNPSNSDTYRMRMILNPLPLLEEQTCNKNETTAECASLNNSKLFVRRSWGKTLTLTMSSQLSEKALSVELLSAPCNITCQGEINTCSGVQIRNINWEDSSESLKIYNPNNDSSPAYYCARISPAFHECCIIYTETILLHPVEESEISVTFSQTIYLPECFMVVSISIALLVSAMFTIRKILGGGSYKCSSISSEGSVEDGLLNSSTQEETSPSKQSPSPALQPQRNVEVLLIYQKDSKEMERTMTEFRAILSSYVSKVWDPLDEEEMERVNENPSMWIEVMLKREEVKVVLVESKNCVDLYKKYPDRHPPVHYHHLDNLYLYIISLLHNNPYLCLNYQRLFIVRFSSIKSTVKSTSVVPCTRYVIPENFSFLITDLVGSNVTRSKMGETSPGKEIQ